MTEPVLDAQKRNKYVKNFTFPEHISHYAEKLKKWTKVFIYMYIKKRSVVKENPLIQS
jgi:hypothetical protein